MQTISIIRIKWKLIAVISVMISIFIAVEVIILRALPITTFSRLEDLIVPSRQRSPLPANGDVIFRLEDGRPRLFQLGNNIRCLLSINDGVHAVKMSDDLGNSDTIEYSKCGRMISHKRNSENGEVLIVDNDGDGLADYRVDFDQSGRPIVKVKLQVNGVR